MSKMADAMRRLHRGLLVTTAVYRGAALCLWRSIVKVGMPFHGIGHVPSISGAS